NEDGRVVGDVVRQSLWKAARQLGHLGSHGVRQRECIRPWQLKDRNADRGRRVEHAAEAVSFGAELDASDVAQINYVAVVARLDVDVGELRFRLEPALRVHDVSELRAG